MGTLYTRTNTQNTHVHTDTFATINNIKKYVRTCKQSYGHICKVYQKIHVFRHAGEHHQTSKKHYFHSGCLTVGVLEKPLEKRAGRNFAPPGTKKLIYFVDDMNMPEVDAYGTVQPHTLIRQHLDYSHWYEKTCTSKPVWNSILKCFDWLKCLYFVGMTVRD